uniref:Uncharacterized protein n=1 Tax=Apteryx owenii TaxID=8824 RepID=A0A8B9PM04_APTOW
HGERLCQGFQQEQGCPRVCVHVCTRVCTCVCTHVCTCVCMHMCCRIVWCCIVWCCIVQCCIVWCCIVWCCIVRCCIVWCCIVQCCISRCCIVWCCIVQCCIVQCCIVQCCISRCCIVWKHPRKEPSRWAGSHCAPSKSCCAPCKSHCVSLSPLPPGDPGEVPVPQTVSSAGASRPCQKSSRLPSLSDTGPGRKHYYNILALLPGNFLL